MKKFLLFFLIIDIVLIGMLVESTTYPDVYYDDLYSGEYFDEYVHVKAMRENWYTGVWSIENEAGEYVVAENSDEWSIRYAMLDDCDPELKKAYNEGSPIKLQIRIYADGDIRIMDLFEYDHTTFGEFAEAMPMILGVVAIGIVGIIILCAVLNAGGPIKTYKMEPPRQGRNERTIESVRIMDSSGPVYGSKTSTTSAVGRAIVGDMVAGPIGAIVGASTAKQTPQKFSDGTMTFRITWSDGSQTTETVSKNSAQYRNLIDMVP